MPAMREERHNFYCLTYIYRKIISKMSIYIKTNCLAGQFASKSNGFILGVAFGFVES